MKYLLRKILFFVLLFSLFATLIYSQGIRVAKSSLQANKIKKILLFDLRLEQSEKLKIVVVYDEANEKIKNEVEKAFIAEGIDVVSVKIENLEDYSENASAIYNVSNNKKIVADYCVQNKVLSISNKPGDVNKGFASLSIGYDDTGLKILINTRQLQSEGQNISSEILNLAIIFK